MKNALDSSRAAESSHPGDGERLAFWFVLLLARAVFLAPGFAAARPGRLPKKARKQSNPSDRREHDKLPAGVPGLPLLRPAGIWEAVLPQKGLATAV